MTRPNPISEIVRLNEIGTGLERRIEPDGEARMRVARALDLASLDAFVAEMRVEPNRAGWHLSGRVLAEAHGAHPRHRFELEAPRGPLYGEWDEKRLTQALANLLGNAAQHADGKPGFPAGLWAALEEAGMTALGEDDDGDARTLQRALHKAKIAHSIVRAVDGIDALDVLNGTGGRRKIAP